MSERYSRQKDLVPEENLAECNITIIGLGAIGRQVALQLSAMGANNLSFIDFDNVEESNIASQGYYESDLGKLKVEATKESCLKINSSIDISALTQRFKKSKPVGNVVFCCVDSIQTRKFIWDAVKDKVDFFVDGRMSGESLRVIAVDKSNEKSYTHYPTTLFKQSEAHSGSCTAKSTIYCANIAAGMMVAKFAGWLRGHHGENDVLFSITSDDIMVME
jgi:sulfur carrier protein ThiS adenylyltransferase